MNRASSLLSQVKCPTTFIIQPPSSSLLKPTTLLAKRCQPIDFEDILVKKIKTESTLSESNSHQSPIIKENSEDGIYESSEGLECRSAIDDPKSPSSKSFNDDVEKGSQMRILEDILIPQRSMSTPSGAFMLHKTQDPQRQIQNALEVLQKKILLEQQASIIKNMIQRAQLTQEPLMIPPLQSTLKCEFNPFENYGGQPKPIFKTREGEPEIIVGEVEYPLLSMASTIPLALKKSFNFQNRAVEAPSKKGKKGEREVSDPSSLSNSDSEVSEELEKDTRKKRKATTKKTSVPKGKKNQKRKEL